MKTTITIEVELKNLTYRKYYLQTMEWFLSELEKKDCIKNTTIEVKKIEKKAIAKKK